LFVNKTVSRLLATIQSFLTGRVFLGTAGAVVGLFVLLNYIVLPLYVNQGGTHAVPAVIGMRIEEARAILEQTGLRAVEAETRPDPKFPPGTIVQQNPQPQSVVKSGRRVYLTISGGEVQVHVPSLRGRSLRDARFALERFGLKLGGVGYDTSDTFPENTIIEQSLPSETKVARGTSVSILVSRGRRLDAIPVPDVIGRTLAEAERILTEAGLTLGQVTYQASFDLIPNTVVEQYPRVGEAVAVGSAVALFVVKAGKPAEEIQIPGTP
jgi:serine/threonine-protein kinase